MSKLQYLRLKTQNWNLVIIFFIGSPASILNKSNPRRAALHAGICWAAKNISDVSAFGGADGTGPPSHSQSDVCCYECVWLLNVNSMKVLLSTRYDGGLDSSKGQHKRLSHSHKNNSHSFSVGHMMICWCKTINWLVPFWIQLQVG